MTCLSGRARANRLQLNHSKTSVLWCPSARRQHVIPAGPVRIGNTSVLPVSSVRDLGVYIDVDVTMKAHVTNTVKACFSSLRQLRSEAFFTETCFADPGPCFRGLQSRLLHLCSRRRFRKSAESSTVGTEVFHIATKHGVSIHAYADDLQTYTSCTASDQHIAFTVASCHVLPIFLPGCRQIA